MASPKVHLLPTAVLASIYFFAVAPLFFYSRQNLIIILIIGLGFLMDVDHLSAQRIQKILRGEKGPVPGHVNLMHTWIALFFVIVGCYAIENYLPLVSYGIHILIDAGDRGNLQYHGSSPLPEFLHGFIPECLKYETGLII